MNLDPAWRLLDADPLRVVLTPALDEAQPEDAESAEVVNADAGRRAGRGVVQAEGGRDAADAGRAGQPARDGGGSGGVGRGGVGAVHAHGVEALAEVENLEREL